MGEIYKNPTVTIAAGNATSANEGFLMKRSLPSACPLPFYVSENKPGTIWLQDQKTFNRFPEPLDSRAWTLQEFLLSPRILLWFARGRVALSDRELEGLDFHNIVSGLPVAFNLVLASIYIRERSLA